MHTLIATLAGFLFLGFCYFVSHQRKVRFLRFFPSMWLVVCVIHLCYGVMSAGYGLKEEFQIHLLIYGAPVLGWFALTQYLRRKPFL